MLQSLAQNLDRRGMHVDHMRHSDELNGSSLGALQKAGAAALSSVAFLACLPKGPKRHYLGIYPSISKAGITSVIGCGKHVAGSRRSRPCTSLVLKSGRLSSRTPSTVIRSQSADPSLAAEGLESSLLKALARKDRSRKGTKKKGNKKRKLSFCDDIVILIWWLFTVS